MSAANVEFLRLDGSPCRVHEKPQRFTFRCVKHNQNAHPLLQNNKCANLLIADAGHGIPRDPQNQNGGRTQWDFDGNKEAPTFTPSIDCSQYCGWHGYIRNGRCVETSGEDSK